MLGLYRFDESSHHDGVVLVLMQLHLNIVLGCLHFDKASNVMLKRHCFDETSIQYSVTLS